MKPNRRNPCLCRGFDEFACLRRSPSSRCETSTAIPLGPTRSTVANRCHVTKCWCGAARDGPGTVQGKGFKLTTMGPWYPLVVLSAICCHPLHEDLNPAQLIQSESFFCGDFWTHCGTTPWTEHELLSSDLPGAKVPITKNQEATIMEEGEFYAIVTCHDLSMRGQCVAIEAFIESFQLTACFVFPDQKSNTSGIT